MSILLDIFIVAILIIFLLIGKKKGFVYTAIELVGWIAIAVFAIPLADVAANWVYDTFINNAICDAVNTAITDIGNDSVSTAINDYIEKLPEFISSQLVNKNITASYILNQSGFQNNIAGAVSNVIRPLVCPLISTVFSILIAVVGVILVRLVAKILGGIVKKIPLVGSVNGLLGAVLGFVKGVVISVIIVFIISTVLSFKVDGIFGITNDTVSETYIFKSIVGFLP